MGRPPHAGRPAPLAIARAGSPLRALGRRWAVPGRIAGYGVCLLVGPALTAMLLLAAHRSGSLLLDFQTAYYPAGRAVLHGHSPYVAPAALHAASDPFVYPPIAAWLFAPLAVLPYAAAAVVYFLLVLGSTWAALALLGVRHPRVYTLVCAWPAAMSELQAGAVGGLLLLGVAVAWRRRGTRSGLAVLGLLCAVKLFLWPLLLWPLVTRGVRAAATAAAATAALLVLPWAAIGFAGLTDYPQLLQALQRQEGDVSYALPSLVGALGLPRACVLVAAVGGVAALWLALRQPDPTRRERSVLTVCIVLALALSPIVWVDYLLLLAAPIALVRPRLGGLWLVPAAMLAAPTVHPSGRPLPLVIGWVVILAVGLVVVRDRPRRRRARQLALVPAAS